MSYNKYVKSLRNAGAALSVLLLAACGDSTDGTGTTQTGLPSAAETQISLEGIDTEGMTWGDIVYGNADAPVEVIEYASLTCPHCATFEATVLPKVLETYVATGKVRFVYRNFLMNRVDLAASTVARCGDMDVTQKLMEVYFARQHDWAGQPQPLDELAAIARRIGISRAEFDRCLSNTDMQKHLTEMRQIAMDTYGVNSTPTLFVNGKRVDSNAWEDLSDEIESALK